MAEVVYDTRRGASAVAWTALVIAILALIIAWLAYNRAGRDLEDTLGNTIESTVQEGVDTMEEGVDRGPDGVDDGAR